MPMLIASPGFNNNFGGETSLLTGEIVSAAAIANWQSLLRTQLLINTMSINIKCGGIIPNISPKNLANNNRVAAVANKLCIAILKN